MANAKYPHEVRCLLILQIIQKARVI